MKKMNGRMISVTDKEDGKGSKFKKMGQVAERKKFVVFLLKEFGIKAGVEFLR